MTMKAARLKLALAWILSLVVVAAGSHLIVAQTNNADRRVVSGSDLGFRIDSERSGVPTGHFVIRVNGNWVEVREGVVASRLTQ
jgi:hypothetical protein